MLRPRPPRHRGLRAAPALAALIVAALAAGCTRQPTPGLPPGTAIEDLPDSESWGVRLRSSADGQPRLAIDAPYLARYDRPDSASVYLGPAPADTAAVSLRVYDGGRLAATVEAREAWLYDDDDRIVARGAVRATVRGEDAADVRAASMTIVGRAIDATGGVRASVQGGAAQIRAGRLRIDEGGGFEASGGTAVDAEGGRRLRADRVVWDAEAQRFRAPGAFAFDGPGERVRGVGLSATRDLSRYSFRNATGEVEVRE